MIRKIIKDVWEEVFQYESIDERENFFDLGGHSLTAAKIISKLNKKDEINLSVSDIFDFPTIESLTEHTEKNSSKRRKPSSLKKWNRSTLYPLSRAQKRLWFLYQLRPEIPLYSMPLKMTLIGNLDLKALKKALNYLMKRHEGLRTQVNVEKGEPYQKILPENTKFPVLQYSGHNPIEKWHDLIAKPFNLEKDILCYCFVHQSNTSKTTLGFVFHHIIFDDWSMTTFVRELNWCYQKAKEDQALNLEPLKFQYVDFSVWEDEYFNRSYLKNQLEYWKTTLSTAPQMPLPFDRVRPKLLSYCGDNIITYINSHIFIQLKDIANKHQVSLFILFMSIFKIAISLFTNAQDIVVGSPVTNRPFSEQKDTIGYFVNTLVFRTIFSKEESFLAILMKVKERILKGYDAQEVPFEMVIDALSIPRKLNENPLFQIMFSIAYESEITPLQLGSTQTFNMDTKLGLSKFDLSLHVLIQSDKLELNFEYLTEIFNRETIECFSYLYLKIAEQVTRNPLFIVSETFKEKLSINLLTKSTHLKEIEFAQNEKLAISTNETNLISAELYSISNPLAQNNYTMISDLGSHPNQKDKIGKTRINKGFDEEKLEADSQKSFKLKPSNDLDNLENQLLDIWKEILNKNEIDIDGSFFDFGGNSILILQLCDKINQNLGISISLVDLFEYPTIRRLARYCNGKEVNIEHKKKTKLRKKRLVQSIKAVLKKSRRKE